jgi:hypothetical protein
MSTLFAFKLTLVPFFILALSLAGRRWGTAVSGWLVALPVVAGLLSNGGSLWALRRFRAARFS